MKTFLVGDWEYLEDGSLAIDAWTEKGAARRYRRMTIGRGRPDTTELAVYEPTSEELARFLDGEAVGR